MFNQRFQGVVSAASKDPSEGQPLGDQSTTPGADTLRWDSSSVGLAQISTLDSGLYAQTQGSPCKLLFNINMKTKY